MLVELNSEEFELLLKNAIEKSSLASNPTKIKEQVNWLTRAEVIKMLKVNPSTLYNWNKQGRLPRYYIGSRVYYKKQEIEAAMIKL